MEEWRKRGAVEINSLPLRAPTPDLGEQVAVAAQSVLSQVSGAFGTPLIGGLLGNYVFSPRLVRQVPSPPPRNRAPSPPPRRSRPSNRPGRRERPPERGGEIARRLR